MGLSTIFKKLLIGGAFSADEGRIKLFGRMYWIMYPARAFAHHLQDVGKKLGPAYLWKMGYDAANDAGKEMVGSMQLKPKGGWITINAIIELLDFIGYGKPEFIKSDIKKDGHHHIIIHVKDNPVIEHATQLYRSKSLVCNWFMGVYTAHGELELGTKNGHLKETKCLTKGSPYCEWESRW